MGANQNQEASSAHPPQSVLRQGDVVGGRFEIERAVADDPMGVVLAAKDQKTGRAIAVRVFCPGLIATEDALDLLREEVRCAADTSHRNIAATYGMGTTDAGDPYVASEWIEGKHLAEVVAEKKESGQPMSLRGAYNVVAHVCKALDAARQAGSSHGALRPDVVWVSSAGRVKVSHFGIDRAVIRTAGPAALGSVDHALLAPEVKGGATPDTLSDVFGLGGLLYTMLTGRLPTEEFVAPSDVHPEADEEVDRLLLRCLAADPAARYGTPKEVKDALVALAVDTAAAEDDQDFGVELDLDVDIGSIAPKAMDADSPVPESSGPRRIPPPARKGRKVPSPPKRSSAKKGLPKPKKRSPQEAAALVEANAPAPQGPVLSAEVDIGAVLAKITENDAPRWMVVKDNMDHGPFSGRELVQAIIKGEVLSRHQLLNTDSGERRLVGDAPEFAEFVEQYRLKKAETDHAAALQRSDVVEKRSNRAKFLILAVVAGLVGIIAIGFGLTREEAHEETHASAGVGDLYERGEIEITGSAGILPDPPPPTAGHRRRRRSGGSGGARGGGSYEDAMNQVINLGSAENRGSEARLSPAQVARVMNGRINSLVPCVAREPGVGQVRIDLAIAGTGQVLGASVRTGSESFQRCISGRVRQIRFPSFASARMGASYTFSAN